MLESDTNERKLEKIIQVLPDEARNCEILNCYTFGSRVYGNYTEDSDYDYKIVLKDYKDPDEDLAYEQGNINLTLYSETLFTKLIKEHDIMSLICIFEPSNLKIKDTIPFESFFLLDLQKLKQSVVREASSTWYKPNNKKGNKTRAKARLLWKDGNSTKGKKNIGHAIRYLLFGLQIVNHGTIVDFEAANPVYKAIQSIGSDNFSDYEQIFSPMYNSYFSKFREVIAEQVAVLNKFQFSLTGNFSADSFSKGENTINLLSQFNVSTLTKLLSIQCTRHKKYSNLYFLQTDKVSPEMYSVTQECKHGLVLSYENNSWVFVASPFSKMIMPNDNTTYWKRKKLSEPIEVVELIEGSQIMLFMWNKEPIAFGDNEAKFWELWENNAFPKEENMVFTFMIVAKECKKIVEINKETLVLIAVRDIATGQELDVNTFAEKYNWNAVKQFPKFASSLEVVSRARELDPTIQRGFMIYDASKLRMKVESPVYKSITDFTFDELDLVLNRYRMVEILRHLPFSSMFESFNFQKLMPMYLEIKPKYDEFVSLVEQYKDIIFSHKDPKTAADEAKKYNFGSILMTMKKEQKTDVRKYLSEMDGDLLKFFMSKTFTGFPHVVNGPINLYREEK